MGNSVFRSGGLNLLSVNRENRVKLSESTPIQIQTLFDVLRANPKISTQRLEALLLQIPKVIIFVDASITKSFLVKKLQNPYRKKLQIKSSVVNLKWFNRSQNLLVAWKHLNHPRQPWLQLAPEKRWSKQHRAGQMDTSKTYGRQSVSLFITSSHRMPKRSHWVCRAFIEAWC